jgi:hypothetical protein
MCSVLGHIGIAMSGAIVYVNYGKRLHLQTTNSVRDENPGVHSQGLRELAVTNWN